ncbi:MAG: ATP synthase subunit C [Brevinematales bacterium]|jgi:V/A-type H+-transporting ATPase subunit K
MLFVGILVLALLTGGTALIYFRYKKENISGKIKGAFVKTIGITGLFSILILSVGLLSMTVTKVHAQAAQTSGQSAPAAEVKSPAQSQLGLGLVAAALAFGLGALGAGIAVGMSGAAAIGAISENPKMFGSAIVFVGLAEGIAIYGIVMAILILGRV